MVPLEFKGELKSKIHAKKYCRPSNGEDRFHDLPGTTTRTVLGKHFSRSRHRKQYRNEPFLDHPSIKPSTSGVLYGLQRVSYQTQEHGTKAKRQPPSKPKLRQEYALRTAEEARMHEEIKIWQIGSDDTKTHTRAHSHTSTAKPPAQSPRHKPNEAHDPSTTPPNQISKAIPTGSRCCQKLFGWKTLRKPTTICSQ